MTQRFQALTNAERDALNTTNILPTIFNTDEFRIEQYDNMSKWRPIDSGFNESWFLPMSGITDTSFELLGEFTDITTGLTGNYTTPTTIGNQHIYLRINSLTGSGNVIITGASISESTQVPIDGDTETITIDTAGGQLYQTNLKFLDLDSVSIDVGITSINYDIGIVGYIDGLNRNYELLGYRCDIRTAGTNSDLTIRIRKVQDDGDKKMSIVDIENFGFDSQGASTVYTDNVRTGGNDRSFTTNEQTPNNFNVVFKIGDFLSYFSNDENVIEGKSKNEGIIVDFLGSPSGGLTAIDHLTFTLFGLFFS